ncbi:hypothetical protein IDM48_02180 [Rothia amarae]|uniref:Sarcosine oxidase subunit gamma n=1 Tax=Rothia amarae TaxID=169480 RepID=A0A7H2BKR9_9MICC|nr:sarcosine oxidase subunit gamma family protein [Rothia amarae]QNV40265.1 hypothetical protein IDM48_02180 [Rothia amarae]
MTTTSVPLPHTDLEEGIAPSTASEFAEDMDRLSDNNLQIQEVPSLTLMRIEVDPYSEAARRMQKVLGAELPKAPGEVSGDKKAQEIFFGTRKVVACLWVHEDTFLVVSQVDPAKLGRALNSALGKDPGLVLDVSFNRSVLELAGSDIAEVLARTVSFEENAPKFFGEGSAWRCNVGESEVMLWRIGEHQYLMVPRNSHTPGVVVSVFDAIEEVKDA